MIEGNVGYCNVPVFEDLVPVTQLPTRVERETVETNQDNEKENQDQNQIENEPRIDDVPLDAYRNEDEEGNVENRSNDREKAEDVNINGEQVVRKIAGYRTVRGREGDYYLFRVVWEDGDVTEERIDMFFDEEEGEDPTVNAEFLDFELHHQKINFRAVPPPAKKRQKRSTDTD